MSQLTLYNGPSRVRDLRQGRGLTMLQRLKGASWLPDLLIRAWPLGRHRFCRSKILKSFTIKSFQSVGSRRIPAPFLSFGYRPLLAAFRKL
jgi:hypothetical protein